MMTGTPTPVVMVPIIMMPIPLRCRRFIYTSAMKDAHARRIIANALGGRSAHFFLTIIRLIAPAPREAMNIMDKAFSTLCPPDLPAAQVQSLQAIDVWRAPE